MQNTTSSNYQLKPTDFKIAAVGIGFGSIDLFTIGLSRFGQPELTMRHIPAGMKVEAEFVLGLIAGYMFRHDVAANKTIKMEIDFTSIGVRVIPETATKFRVIDNDARRTNIPWFALSGAILIRSARLKIMGDTSDAIALLKYGTLTIPERRRAKHIASNHEAKKSLRI